MLGCPGWIPPAHVAFLPSLPPPSAHPTSLGEQEVMAKPPQQERHLHGCGSGADGLGWFSGVAGIPTGVAGIPTSVTFIAVPVYLIMQLWTSYIRVCVSVCR